MRATRSIGCGHRQGDLKRLSYSFWSSTAAAFSAQMWCTGPSQIYDNPPVPNVKRGRLSSSNMHLGTNRR